MKPVTLRQLELIVEYMARHKDLALGRVRSKEGRALSERLWQELANSLNCESVDSSSYRSAKEWNKFYNDYKCRIKNKSRKIAESQRQTGSGPSDAPPLSEIEERLCAIIGPDKFQPLPVRQESLPHEGDQSILISQIQTEDDHPGDELLRVIVVEDQEDPVPKMVQDELVDPSMRQKSKRTANVTAATTTENEVEKSKMLLAEIHKAQLEVSQSQVQAQLARNIIEQQKVVAINNLASAAWALVNVFKREDEKNPRKRAHSSSSEE